MKNYTESRDSKAHARITALENTVQELIRLIDKLTDNIILLDAKLNNNLKSEKS